MSLSTLFRRSEVAPQVVDTEPPVSVDAYLAVTYSEADFRDAVEAGAAVLDRYFGDDGWVDRIDLSTLDAQDPDTCPLAQLFPDLGWMRATDVILAARQSLGEDASDYGFAGADHNPHWRELILTRRAQRLERHPV